MKRIIRLTENDLHRIVKESVRKVLKEDDSFYRHIAQNIIDDIQRKNFDLSKMSREDFIRGVMSNYQVDYEVARATADMAGL